MKPSVFLRNLPFFAHGPFTHEGFGLLLDAEGKCAEAQPLHEPSEAIREKALGPDNSDVTESLTILGWLVRQVVVL